MLEWLKTSTGAYNLQFIIANIAWFVGGAGLIAGFQLNKVKTIEAEAKAKKSEDDRDAVATKLAETTAELERTKAQTAALAAKAAPRTLTEQQRTGFFKFVANAPKGRVALQSVAGNQEALDYATTIRSMLTMAGFDVVAEIRMFIATSPRTTSLTMKVKTTNAPAHAGVIQKGFEAVGITVPCLVAQHGDEITEETPIIYIENKP